MEQDDDSNDVISNLPDHVIDLILVHLPINEAVRTSILSRTWRNRWTSISSIIVDNCCFPTDNHVSTIENNNLELTIEHLKIASAVNQVLLRHIGPIREFVLDLADVPLPFWYVDNWIVFLSRNGIKELSITSPDLPFPSPEHILHFYEVPSSLFYCKELCSLRLELCQWTVPPISKGLQNLTTIELQFGLCKVLKGFEGFPNLKKLVVGDVQIPFGKEDGLSLLISKCPLLEKLDVSICNDYNASGHLEIHAPNLRYLTLDASMDRLSIRSSLLVHVNLSCQVNNGFSIKSLEYMNMIENLIIDVNLLKAFCKYQLPKTLSTIFCHLKCLNLEMNFTRSKHILAALCICRSSPNLQKLQINSWFVSSKSTKKNTWFWDGKILDCLLSHLQYVKMCIGHGSTSELEFIRFLLTSAPVLDNLSIAFEFGDINEKPRVIEELLQLPRASTQVHINFV